MDDSPTILSNQVIQHTNMLAAGGIFKKLKIKFISKSFKSYKKGNCIVKISEVKQKSF